MPRRCSVPGCRTNYRDKWSVGKYVSCYGFPSDLHTLKKWLIAIGRQNFVPNYDNAVCAKHFDASSFLTEDMYRGANGELKVFKFAKPKLKNGAVPSVFLGGSLEGESDVEKTNWTAFGAKNEVTTPLSTLINGLQHGNEVILRNHDALEIDDTKTCMDFVEVEMKDPENEGTTLNLDENCCGSVDLGTTDCISVRKNGQHLAKKMKNRDTGGGEFHNNYYSVTSSRNSCNLVERRGFSNCIQKKDNLEHDQVEQNPFQVRSSNGAKFVNKVIRDSWRGVNTLNSQNLSHHTSDAVLDKARKGGVSDGSGVIGILEDAGSQNESLGTDGNNHQGGDGSANDDISGGVCCGGKGVVTKKINEEDGVNSVVMNTANPDETRESQAKGGDQNCVTKNYTKKNQAVQKNCGDISSKDGFCGGNGVVRKKESKGVQSEENGNLVMDAYSTQSYPGETNDQDFSVGNSDEEIGIGKNFGFVKNTKKNQAFQKDCDIKDGISGGVLCVVNGVVTKKESKPIPCPENGNLELMDADLSPGETNDQDFSVGNLDVKDGVGKNGGFVKNTKKIQAFEKGCDIKDDKAAPENGNLVVMDAHPSYSGETNNQDLSVGNLDVKAGKTCGFVKNTKKIQAFQKGCDIKDGVAVPENGNLVLTDAHSIQCYSGQMNDEFSVGNLEVKAGVGKNCGFLKNTKKIQAFQKGCDIKDGVAVPENGNLVLIDAHPSYSGDMNDQDFSVGNFEVKAGVGKNCGFLKNTKKIQAFQKGCDIKDGVAVPENGNLVLIDAHPSYSGDMNDQDFSVGNFEVKAGVGKNCGFLKNTKKIQAFQKGCGVKDGVAVLSTENGNLVLMDAHPSYSGDMNDQDFAVGNLEVKAGVGKNCGFLKNTKKIQAFQKGCDIKDGVAVSENGNLVLMDANVSDGTRDLGVSVGGSEVKVGGQNRGSEKNKDGEDEGPSEVQEWEGRGVKEELFRGLGLVPRGVLHDRSVDRRHCVTGQRRSAVSAKRLRSPTKTAVFYPPGTAMFDTEKFIGEIQRRPAIYDVRSKVYSNRVAKLKYWHEVGQEMYKGWDALDQMERRTLVKELQIKWKSIRDHFMRQLKQNINGEGPKKKKYVHFDQLQFLTANLGVKRPRHSFKPPKHEPEEEYMELTPELPEERHFSFMTSAEGPDYDEHEVPVATALLPQQPEDLSYHPKDLAYHHHQELSYHKELEGDRMGNKMFLLSLLPIMERLPDHSNIRARLQLMEVLQTFVALEDSSHRDFYNYHDEKQSCGDASQQHSTASHSDSES